MKYLLPLILVMSFSKLSFAGTEMHGGSWVRSQFYTKAAVVAEFVRTHNTENLDLQKLADLVKTMDVQVTDEHLTFNGQQVDAINFFPESKVVKINYQIWMDHFTLNRDVYGLIFHELLPFFGVDDSKHQISDRLKIAAPLWGCLAVCADKYRVSGDVSSPGWNPFNKQTVIGEGDTALSAFLTMQQDCHDRIKGPYLIVPSTSDQIPTQAEVASITNACVKN